MKVLVVGGTGFVSHAVVLALAGAGHDVACFHRGEREADLPRGVARVLGDRKRIAEHRRELCALRPEVVVDCVAYTEADATSLLETFSGVTRRVVMLSSMDVYRAWGRLTRAEPGPLEETPIREDAPLRESRFPRRKWSAQDPVNWDYDKIPVERAVLDAQLETAVLRLPMVYGPGDHKRRRVTVYRERMDTGRTIDLDPRIASWRSTRCYVRDVADAIVAAAESRTAGGIYNVGDAHALTEREWVHAIGRVHGWNGQIMERPADDIEEDYRQDLVLDVTRIQLELGWTSRTPLDAAIRAS